MKILIKILLLPLFFICLRNVYSLDINITEKNAETYYRGVYARGSGFLNEVSAIGALELGNMFTLKSGVSFGMTANDMEINTLISAGLSPFANIPLSFSVLHLYNGLPDYEAHVNSIMPLISFNAQRAGISLGVNFRLTTFFKETTVFESILSLYAYFNIINNDTLRIGLGAGNFNDFHAKNMGAYSLNIYLLFQLDENWLITNNLEFMQSGGDGLTAAFYGAAFRTGVKYSW